MKRNVYWFIAVLMLISLIGASCAAPSAPVPADNAGSEASGEATEGGEEAVEEVEVVLPESVTIGIQIVTSTDIMAKQQGWAEEMLGVPIEWVSFDSGKDAILGLGAGGVDMTLVGSAPTSFGLSSGVQGEVAWIFNLLGANEALVAREDAGISSLEDLAGKVLAVPFGSTTHYDMLQAISLAGLTPADVTLLDMDPNSMVAAFERGDIDAGWVWYPALQGLYDSGGVKVADALDMAKAGFPTADVLVVNPEFGAAYPDTVARYVSTLHKGTVLAREDLDAAAQIMVDEFGMDIEDAKIAMTTVERLDGSQHLGEEYLGTTAAPGPFSDSLHGQAHFLVEQQIIEEAFDEAFYAERVNPRYIEMAIEKGYIEE